MFDSNVFEAVNAIKPSWRNELEITDAIQYLVDKGYRVYPYVHTGWWIDTGKPNDMLAANSLVLEELDHTVEGHVDKDSILEGKVTIERGAEIINSRIRGPAIIGQETRIVNSYVGPFTSIYHHCVIENSEIEHSIVLENSQHRRPARARRRQPHRPSRPVDALAHQAQSLQTHAGRPQPGGHFVGLVTMNIVTEATIKQKYSLDFETNIV